jgi:hypothetical protein
MFRTLTDILARILEVNPDARPYAREVLELSPIKSLIAQQKAHVDAPVTTAASNAAGQRAPLPPDSSDDDSMGGGGGGGGPSSAAAPAGAWAAGLATGVGALPELPSVYRTGAPPTAQAEASLLPRISL